MSSICCIGVHGCEWENGCSHDGCVVSFRPIIKSLQLDLAIKAWGEFQSIRLFSFTWLIRALIAVSDFPRFVP